MRVVALVAVAACWLGFAPASFGSDSHSRRAGLAFVKTSADGSSTIWASAADGGHQHRLGRGYEPLLSPNGRLIAVAGFGAAGASLVIYRAGGGQLGHFGGLTTVPVTPLAWSRDSRYLAVSLSDTLSGTGAGDAALDVIDTRTGAVTATVHGVIDGASFAPSGADRLVFGLSKSSLVYARANLFTIAAAGSSPKQLTHNGRSINPVWGRRGIVFDHVRERGEGAAPVFQIDVLHGSRAVQITHTRPGAPVDGLQPVAVDRNGERLLANFVGTDSDQAYVVNLTTHAVREIRIRDEMVGGAGISPNGRRLLVSYGAFEGPSNTGRIATIPFAGGRPRVLVRGAVEPGWPG